jgi:phosphoglycerate dehydrogenase-like enzyme
VKGIAKVLVVLLTVSSMARAVEPVPPMDNDTAKLVEQLSLIESDKPVREMPGWKRPRKIVVGAIGHNWVERFRQVAPGVQLIVANGSADALALVPDADAVIGLCDPGIIAAGRKIKWIQALSAGVEDCASIPALRERGVILTNAQRVNGPAMAEHTLGLVIALNRGFVQSIENQQTGVWRNSIEDSELHTIAGKTMLVCGLGGIGTEVARRADALGMKVIATRASGKEKPDFVSYIGSPDELATLVKQADVVVNSTPLTDQTRGLFNARLFAQMKTSAYFINVGRGGSVVTEDLTEALNKGIIAGAGLDVTDPEPLPPEHPLWHAPNTIITPHISAHTDAGSIATLLVARENLRRYTGGEKMLSVVDTARGY